MQAAEARKTLSSGKGSQTQATPCIRMSTRTATGLQTSCKARQATADTQTWPCLQMLSRPWHWLTLGTGLHGCWAEGLPFGSRSDHSSLPGPAPSASDSPQAAAAHQLFYLVARGPAQAAIPFVHPAKVARPVYTCVEAQRYGQMSVESQRATCLSLSIGQSTSRDTGSNND